MKTDRKRSVTLCLVLNDLCFNTQHLFKNIFRQKRKKYLHFLNDMRKMNSRDNRS